MNQQSFVVEASLIYRLFEKDIILGKGKDPIYGISSSIYKLNKNNNVTQDFEEDWGSHALQIYENLNQEIFDIKVCQLQKAMTTYLNPYSTRIILIAKEKIHQMQYNLHVVYEFGQVNKNAQSLREQKEGYMEDRAIQFLEFLCHNFILGARYSNEFLDISPQNIFISGNNSYIVSNFGITYIGTKFHRIYTPSTDPIIMKEKKPSNTNILYNYAFKAGLLTLCLMTQIDPKDFFFEDGQFKEQLLDNLLYLLQEDKQENKIRQKHFIVDICQFFDTLTYTREQDYKEQQQTFTFEQSKNPEPGKKFKYKKSERYLQHKYSKELLEILKKLLNVSNIQSRSIFQQLICQPENILGVKNPYDEKEKDKYNYSNGTFKDDQLNGCGIIQLDEQDEQNKQKNIRIIQICGSFKDGEPQNAYNKNSVFNTKFECQMENLQCLLPLRYVNNEFLYLNDEIVSPINPIGLQKKESIYYFKGKYENGQLKKGVSYQLDKTIFEGEFKNNQPYEGKMIYPNSDIFEGFLEGFNKKKGTLIFNGRKFEGQFQNDQFFKGYIEYEDGGFFFGNFKNGQKVKAGIYKYPNSTIQYQGLYAEDVRHGKGTFIDKSKDNFMQEVVYNYGMCETKLNEHFEQALKEIQEKQKQSKNLQKNNKQQNENDEEIQEDIEENPGDDNEDGEEG